MNKFGKTKLALLSKLVETYNSDNKVDVRRIFNKIKKNDDFKEMNSFYEEIENKYFSDKETAKLYVEEISVVIKNKSEKISKFCDELKPILGDINISEDFSFYENLYSDLDTLMESDTLQNIDKKILAKKRLIEHLTTPKPSNDDIDLFNENQNLLNAVLVHDFNVLYSNSLNEEEKVELKSILSLSIDDVKITTLQLKEEVLNKISTILTESKDIDLTTKLQKVESEVQSMIPNKFNLYKLKQLKGDLN